MHDVSGRPVISNCGTPTEKILEFLDRQLKPIMQKSWSYIKDSGDFRRKIKNVTNPWRCNFSYCCGWWIYSQVYHINPDWKLLKKHLMRKNKFISTDNIVKMAEFALKTIIFSLMVKLNNRSQVPLLELNLHQLTLFYGPSRNWFS